MIEDNYQQRLFITSLHAIFLFFNWRMFALQFCIGFCTQQYESAVSIDTSLPLEPIYHLPLLWSLCVITQHMLSCMCYTATSHQVSFLHMVIYMFQCYCLNLSHLLHPLLCPQLHSFLANMFTSTILLDSIYIC